MGVKIHVYGAVKESDEYRAALKMQQMFKDSIPGNAEGEILIYASATLYGQSVKDVDLIVFGNIENCSVPAEFYVSNNGDERKKIHEKVEVRSFLTVIEVKRHDISSVSLKGTDLYVKYHDNLHCVTVQSNQQKESAKQFFKSAWGSSPFITNVIWLTQVTPNEVKGLLSTDGGSVTSNVLGSEFVFGDFVQMLVWQKNPGRDGKKYIFSSDVGGCSAESFRKALSLFSGSKEQMGELTRKKIEMITNKALQGNAPPDQEGKLSVYRGKAGTGKTIGLIQTAIQLVDEKQARVIMLTYNKALVLDIRRLFALADLPDMFEEKCVGINTIHAFFMRLANKILYDDKLEAAGFIGKYETILNELNDLMSDDDGVALVKDAIAGNGYLDWDYLMIDEAQDMADIERDMVLKLYDKGKVFIADGGSQFVRRLDVCDWTTIRERNNINLKYCLRQKENLIDFLNAFTLKMEVSANRIVGNGKLHGGKVIITTDDKLTELHKQEMEALKRNGNIAYDMLYLVPHSLVEKKGDGCGFIRKREFEAEGIHIWDGTVQENRNTYSIDNNEIRVLQYESSRGLEGWTVVCMDFDTFMEEKSAEYDKYEKGKNESLLLEGPEEKKRKHLYNWAMIPLTRAIDTLVITVKDPESEIGRMLKEISKECGDYVDWYM